MAMSVTFTDKQLNYLKFISIVVDEFTKALRQTFVSLWDNKYGTAPGYQPWDDSLAVRTMFKKLEGTKNVPPSINEWDCTELIQSIIFSCSFSTSVPGSKKNTLSQMYVLPKKLAGGSLHTSITGATQEETVALSVDQLRRLRNKACHSSSSKEIDKVNFDNYVQLTKDIFKALGVTATVIDNIRSLTEDDFPSGRVRTLENDFLGLLRQKTETEENINDPQQMRKDILNSLEMLDNIIPGIARLQDVEALNRHFDHLMKDIGTDFRTVPVLSQSCLPPRVPHFVGREKEINQATSYLVNDMARVVSICGSVGIGKTALAMELGHRLSEQDKLVIFVSLKSIATAEVLVCKFLCLFEVQIPEGWRSNTMLRHLLCCIFREISKPCILVLDSVDDLLTWQKDEFVDTILAFIQSNAELRVVYTSRENMRYFQNKVPASSLKLTELETNDSIQLLQKNLSDKISNQECRELSDIFLNVPLALVLASTLISEEKLNPADFVKHIKGNPTAVIEVIDEEEIPGQVSLKRLIEFSFSRLSSKYQEKFVELSVFPGTFDAEAASSVLHVDVVNVKRDLCLLQRKSLVEFDEKTKRYSLHDLMKAFLQIKTRENDDLNELVHRSQCRFFDHYLSMVERINNDFLTGEALSAIEKFTTEKENLTFCLKEAIKNSEKHERAVVIIIEMDLLLDTVYRSDPKTIATFYKNWIAECESRKRKLNALQLRISLSFGYLHWPTNEADLLLSETNMPQRRHETLPPEIKGKWLCYYGIRQIHLDKQEDGIKYLEEGVRLLENKPSHKSIELLVLKVLATYYNAKSKKDLADSVVKTALSSHPNEVYKFLLLLPTVTTDLTRKSENEPLLTALVYRIASITKKFGSSNENEKLLQTLQCISENPRCLYQLAQTYFQIGNNIEALKVHRKVLEIWEQTLGHHEDTARSHYSLGITYFNLDHFTNALEEHKKALRMRENLLGDHEDTARSHFEIGITYFKLNELNNALEAQKKALSIREKLLGDHVDTAQSHYAVGFTYFVLNDFTNACEAYKKTLIMLLKLLGDHNDTVWLLIKKFLGDLEGTTCSHYSELREKLLRDVGLFEARNRRDIIRCLPYETDRSNFTVVIYLYGASENVEQRLEKDAREQFCTSKVELIDLAVSPPITKVVRYTNGFQVLPKEKAEEISRDIKQNHDKLRKHRNVTAVYASYKVQNLCQTNTPCVTVCVLGKGKIPFGDDELPTHLGDCEVDVEEGYFAECVDVNECWRSSFPLELGVSIGVQGNEGSGTLGAVLVNTNNKFFVLSCKHVMNPKNDDTPSIIEQPSCLDHSVYVAYYQNKVEEQETLLSEIENVEDRPLRALEGIRRRRDFYQGETEIAKPRQIAKYEPWGGIKDNVEHNGYEYYIDAAIAELSETEARLLQRLGVTLVKSGEERQPTGECRSLESFDDPETMKLHKVGRTTALTKNGTFFPSKVDILSLQSSSPTQEGFPHSPYFYCETCNNDTSFTGNGECSKCNSPLNLLQWLKNCLVIKGKRGGIFAEKGDSGAMVMDQDGQACGIIFGFLDIPSIDRHFALACPMEVVLEYFKRKLGYQTLRIVGETNQ